MNALPAGVFAGLTNLTTLRLSGNPGADFLITIAAEAVVDTKFRVSSDFAGPRIEVDWEASGDTTAVATGTAVIPVGTTVSAVVSLGATSSYTMVDLSNPLVIAYDAQTRIGVDGFTLLAFNPLPPSADPLFAPSLYTFGLESSATGAVTLGTVAATNTSGDPISYALSAGDSARFSIGASDGVLRYIGAGGEDVARTPRYALVVTATAGGLSATAAVQVAIRGICTRTQQVQDAIVGRLSSVSDCAAVTGVQLGGIVGTLNLGGRAIPVLKSVDFAGLSLLEYLYLNENDLSALPADVFAGLTSLKVLNLRRSQLGALPMGVFAGLTRLRTLNLYIAGLNSLPAGVFADLTSLQSLFMFDNQLDVLPADVFAGLTNLELLQVHGNNGAPFPIELAAEAVVDAKFRVNSDFAGPRIAVDWEVSDAAGMTMVGTAVIPAGTTVSAVVSLGAASSYTMVDLRNPALYTKFTGFELSLFTPPSADPLFDQTLYTFGLTGGTGAVVLGTVAATNASGDPISYAITAGDGGRFSIGASDGVLRYIGAGDEDVARTPSYALVVTATAAAKSATAAVQVGSGICTRTQQVQDAIVGRLSSVNCAAVTLPQLGNITGALNLIDKTLTALKSIDFAALTDLEKLYLNENDLSALPMGVFAGLSSLGELNLRGNQLGALPMGVFAGLTSLQVLNLYNAGLDSLPAGVFADLNQLKKLWLVANQLDALPADVFAGLTNLELLQVHGNDGGPFPITIAAEVVSDGLRVRSDFAGPRITVDWEASGSSGATNGTTVIAAGVTASARVPVVAIDPASVAPSNPALDSGFTGFELSLSSLLLKDLEFDPPSYTFALTDSAVVMALGTVAAANNLDAPSYAISAGDGARFSIGATDGVLRYIGAGGEDVARTPSYGLVVTATAGGQSVTAAVQVDIRGICARTQQVQDEIVDRVAAIDCGAVTGGDLGGITGALQSERSRFKNIKALESGDFAGLHNLQNLFLNNNQLSALPADAFAGMSSLLAVFLNNNQLSVLSADVFTGQTGLGALDLSSNQLSALPADVFGELTSLQYLLLSANDLSTLPAGVFAGLTSLTTLGLADNPAAGVDFPITIAAQQVGSGTFRVRSSLVIPDAITMDWEATGGTAVASNGAVTIAAGATTSAVVVLSADDRTAVALSNLSLAQTNGVSVSGVALTGASVTLDYVAFERSDYAFRLLEGLDGSAVALPVGAVAAVASSGATLSYAITAGDSSRFSMGAASGALSYIGSGEAIGATTTPFTLTVTASDGVYSGIAMVVVTVSPLVVFNPDNYRFNLPPIPTGNATAIVVGTVVATNYQDASSGPISYTISAGERARFSIGASDGVVYYIGGGGEDVARTPSYTLTVTAIANGYSAAAAVQVDTGICARTQPVREGIVAKIDGGSDCAAVTLEDLGGISGELNLVSGTITALESGDFAGLTSLTTLNLDNNQLSVLPVDVLADLARLEGLGLSRNQLSTLPAEVFGGLTSLTTLNLSLNQLSALPESVFAGLISLQTLNLADNPAAGVDFPITIAAQQVGSGTFRVRSSLVIPDAITMDWEATGGTAVASNGAVTIAAGATTSAVVVLSADDRTAVALSNLSLAQTNGVSVSGVALTGASVTLDYVAFERSDYAFRLLEGLDGSAVALPVGAVAAVASSGATLSYAITAGDSSRFSMGAASGALSYIGSGETGATTTPFTLTVTASDGVYSGIAIVVVTVSPLVVFNPDNYRFKLPVILTGNTAAVALGTVVATDASSGPISYTISAGERARFSIGASDGVVYYIGGGGEDVARTPSYALTVTAIANGYSAAAAVQVDTGICARTQQVQERIVAKIDGGSDCAAVTREDLGGISGTLQLGNIAMLAVKSVDFAGLSLLKYLYLNENDLSALPADVFADLTSLQVLNLRRSQLGALPMGVFAGLSSLRLLNLYDAGLSSLPEGVFADLTSLRTLYMFSNQLDALPAGVFAGQSSLQYLNLSNNGLDALPAGVFAGQSSLQYLDLRNNGLDALPAGVFAGQSSLQYLDLSNNGLDALSAGVFAGLTALSSLRLQDNRLNALPAGVFAGLTNLTTLRLSGNPGADFLITIAAEAVVDTKFRVSSDFAGPRIEVDWEASGDTTAVATGTAVIPVGTTVSAVVSLGATSSYTMVDLSNPLVIAYDAQTRIGVDGFTLLAFNPLPPSADPLFAPSLYTFGLESSATGAVTLGTVAATNTSGDPISYALSAGDSARFSIGASDGVLRYIGAGGEDVARTPRYALVVTATAGGLSATAAVQVAIRGICTRTQQVQDAIVGRLSSVSDCAAVTGVQLGGIVGTLNLGGRAIPVLKSVDFAGLSLLEYLYLNENDLSALPADVFAGLTSLKVLNLRRSQLGALPMGVFAGLTRLRTLNLYIAGLNSLPAGVFADLTSLQSLFMFDNQLDVLPADVFAGLTNLELLQVHGNNGAPFPIELAAEAVVDAKFRVNSDFAGPRIAVDWEVSDAAGMTMVGTAVIPAGTTVSAVVSLGAASSYTMVDLRNPALYTKFTGFELSLFTPPSADPLFDQTLYTFGLTGGTGAVVLGTVAATNASGDPISYAITAGDGGRFSIGASDGVLRYIGAGDEDVARTPSYALVVTATAAAKSATAAVQVGSGICTRTQQVQDAIVGRLSSVNCAAVTLPQLGNITGALNLIDKTLTALKSIDFAALTDLEKLYLNENDLSALPMGVFAGLSSLGELNLRGNQLGALPMGVFAGLTSLQVLNLYNAGLDSLPAGVFADLNQLKKLWLVANQLDALPADVFAGLTNLELLQVHGNDGGPFPITIAAEVVSDGLRVRSDFAGPRITVDWEASGSSGATNGTTVIAAGVTASARVPVVAIDPASVAPSNPALDSGFTGFELSLSSLLLKDLEFDPPSYTFALTDSAVVMALGTVAAANNLDAPSYAISAGDGARFSIGATDGVLRYIGAGGEDVARTPSYGLVVTATAGGQSVTAAVQVDIRGICARTQQVQDEIVDRVAAIDCGAVTGGDLGGISGALHLSGRAIKALESGDFAGLHNLQNLFLNNNQLSALPAGVFAGLTSLTTLDLGENDVGALPESVFGGLTSLTTLDLGENDVGALPESVFGGLTSLTTLDLGENDVGALPESVFAGLTSLATLDLDNNQLSALPESVFAGLTSLTTLDLDNNQLSALPESVFAGLISLQTLNLADNPAAGVDFPITIAAQQVGSGTFRVRSSLVIPDAITMDWEATGGTAVASNGAVTIAAGATTSAVVVLSADDRTAVALSNLSLAQTNGVSVSGVALTGASVTLDYVAFERSDYAFRLLEGLDGSAVALPVGAVAAVASSGATLSYAITAGDSSRFSMGAASGALSYIGSGEAIGATTNPFTLTVTASDGVYSGIAMVVVTVSPPAVFNPDNYRFNLPPIPTGNATAIVVGTVVATDASSDPISYTISAGERARFSIGASDGVVYYIGGGGEDVARTPSYALVVTATVAAQAVTAAVQVDVRGICARTQQVQDGIVAKIDGVNDCAAVTLEDLGFIEEFSLYDKSITALESWDFAGLRRLENLYLNENQLSALPVGVFTGLTGLGYLNLNENRLSVLPAEVFAALVNLEDLDLSENDVGALPVEVFAALTGLEDLDLSENDLGALPAEVFAALTGLEDLDLSENQLSSLPETVFVGLTSLHTLDLDGNPSKDMMFPITLAVEQVSAGTFQVRSGLVLPVAITMDWEAIGGAAATESGAITIAAGATASGKITLPTNAYTTIEFSNLLFSNNRVQGVALSVSPASLNLEFLKFGQASYAFKLPEGVDGIAAAIPLGAVAASAPMGGAISYAIEAGGSSRFIVGAFSGELSYVGSGEATIGTTFGLTVTASNGTYNGAYRDIATVVVTVSPPVVFNPDNYRFKLPVIPTGNAAAITVGTVTASYPSEYAIATGDSSRFSIGTTDGVLRYIGSGGEDVTLTPRYTLVVSAAAAGQVVTAAVQVAPGICARTKAVQDGIVGQLGVSDCAAVTVVQLGGIEAMLSLANSAIAVLQSGDFAGLTSLYDLDLSENALSALPSDIFAALVNVKELNLGENALSVLPPDIFAALVNVEELNLHNNTLSVLPSDIFAALVNVEELNLHNNALSALPSDIFAALVNVEELNLHNNALSALPMDVFVGLTSLGTLNLSGNPGADFPINLAAQVMGDGLRVRSNFAGPRITVDWEASGSSGATNGTTVIAAGVTASARVPVVAIDPASVALRNPALDGGFNGFALSLSSMLLKDLEFDPPSYTFALTDSAVVMALGTVAATNNLDAPSYAISAGDGARFSIGANDGVLRYIGAGGEDVARTPSYGLVVTATAGGQSVTAAVQVDIRGICARTEAVRDGIVDLVAVSDCAAVTLEDLGGISGELNLLSRAITALQSGDFAGLSSLYYLYLIENQLSVLPADVFAGLSNLQTLLLSSNQLSVLPADVFAGLTSLQVLWLQDNGLTSLPSGVFGGLTSLQYLLLNANDLSTLPAGVFAGLTSLQFLNLADNPGVDFPIALEGEAVSNGFVVNSDFAGPRITVSWEASGDTTAVTSGTAVIAAGTTASALVSVGSAAYTSVTLSNPALHTSFIGFALSLPSPSFTLAASSLMQKALLANEKPLFDSDHYSFTLAAEHNGSVAAFALGAVSAHDPNGDAVGYALGVDDSGKFRIDGDSGALYYIGDGEVAGNSMALVVSASDGTLSASAAVTITVASQRVEKRTQMARMVLSQVGHNIAIHTIDALSGRFAAAAHTRIAGRELTLGSWLGDWMNEGRAAAWDGVEREVDLTAEGRKLKHDLEERLRSGGSFLLPLGGAGEGGGLMQNWSIWGRGKVSSFANQASEVSATGDKWDAWSGYLGVDYRTRDDLLIGAAVSRNVDASTAQLASDVDSRTEVGSQLTGVYPYLHWSGVGHRVWGMFGYGWGEAEVSDSTLGESGIETDLELSILAAGTEKTLLAAGAVEIAAKVDAFAVNMKSAAVSNELNATDTGSRRLRALLSGSRSWGLEGSGGKFIAGASFGGRWDAGDVLNGVGLDVGANLHYEAAAMSLKARGRWLVLHSEDSHQWGLDAALRWRPTALNRGLSVVLAPVWGQPEAKPETLWNSGAAALVSSTASTGSGWTPDHTKLSLGYGIGYHSVLVSPFAELEMESHRMGRLRTGMKLDSDRQSSADLQLSVFGERRNGSSSSTETPARWIGFEVRMGF